MVCDAATKMNESFIPDYSVLLDRILDVMNWVSYSMRNTSSYNYRSKAFEQDARGTHLMDPPRILLETLIDPSILPIDRYRAVENLCRHRHDRIKHQNVSSNSSAALGRCLVFDTEQSLFDGSSSNVSGGFFDVNNAPPWDTWILYRIEDNNIPGKFNSWSSYLVTWVPVPMVDIVQDAIDVNPEQCLAWASDIDSDFVKGLVKFIGSHI